MICDTISNTVNRLNYDSLTVALLKDSHIFYNDAFNGLLFKISIILCAIGVLVAIVGIFLGIVRSNKEKVFEELNKKMLELEKEFRAQIKIQGRGFKSLEESVQTQIVKQAEEFKSLKEDVLRELVVDCLNLAKTSLEKDEFSSFMALNDYCNIYLRYKFEMNHFDLIQLDFLGSLISSYEVKKNYSEGFPISISLFLHSFNELRISYGKIGKINEIWKNLCDKFGGKDNVLEAVAKIQKKISEP